MLNRSATKICYSPAFCEWLKAIGADVLPWPPQGSKAIYLIPAFEGPDESEEIVEDIFEEIFQRELRLWQADQAIWPDTGDFELFRRWFIVESFSIVDDLGLSEIREEG